MFGVPLTQLLLALFQDCFNLLVILLLIGAIFSRKNSIKNGVFLPLWLSYIAATAWMKILPIWALPRHYLYSCLIGLAVVGISGNSIKRWFSDRRPNSFFRGVTGILHGLALLFSAAFCCFSLYAGLTKMRLDWFGLERWITAVAVFYLIFQIAPWKRLPTAAQSEIRKICLYLAVGLFAFQACIWIYILFNAAIKKPLGSFRMHGMAFALEYSQSWQFSRMEQLIMDRWYHPTPMTPAEKLKMEAADYAQMKSGIQEAETFRRSLLVPDATGTTPAQLIAAAAIQFQNLIVSASSPMQLLKTHSLSTAEIVSRIQGAAREITYGPVFDPFFGTWYGKENDADIDQDWGIVQIYKFPVALPDEPVLHIRAMQYRWLGNGFGWYVIAAADNSERSNLILGTEYSIEDGDGTKIKGRISYVQILLREGYTLRISPTDILLDSVTLEERQPRKIVSYGFPYHLTPGRLQNDGEAFQILLSHDTENREPRRYFPLNLQVP